VDPKEQKELKDSWMVMKSRDIPVQVAHGWGGLSQNFMMTDSANLITKPRVERCLLLGDGSSTESPTFMTFSSPLEGRPVSTGHHTNTFETLPHSALLSDDDKCILLISTQNYDGSFPMEHELAQLLHTKLEIIKQGTVQLPLLYLFELINALIVCKFCRNSGREMLLFRDSLGNSNRVSLFVVGFA
jgi:hypothetical protein